MRKAFNLNQLDLLFSDPAVPLYKSLGAVPYAKSVTVVATGKIIARVRPRGFILNSNLVSDVLNRGDCFVVDMETGDLKVLPSSVSITSHNLIIS